MMIFFNLHANLVVFEYAVDATGEGLIPGLIVVTGFVIVGNTAFVYMCTK